MIPRNLAGFVILIQLICTSSADIAAKIDQYIQNLNYNPQEILSQTFSSVPAKFTPHQGRLDSNLTFTVTHKEIYRIHRIYQENAVTSLNQRNCIPGAILLVNQKYLDNNPEMLEAKRAPVEMSVYMQNMDASFTIVPNYDNFVRHLDKNLRNWAEEARSSSFRPLRHTRHAIVKNRDQLRVEMGVDVEKELGMSIDFEELSKKQKTVAIFRITQEFFSVNVYSPPRPSQLFAPEVDLSDLIMRVNDENPPVMVDSVSYGNTIYVKIETPFGDWSEKQILRDIIRYLESTSSSKHLDKKVTNMQIQVYVLGHAVDSSFTAKSLSDVRRFIDFYGNFSKSNMGYPVWYSTQFLKGNMVATSTLTAEFLDEWTTVTPKRLLRIVHEAAYLAKYEVSWEEVRYDEQSRLVATHVLWKQNGQTFFEGSTAEIELAGNCRQVKVVISEATGEVWDLWRILFEREVLPLINVTEIKIYGTTTNAYYNITVL